MCPTLYLWYGDHGRLDGSLGTHVDDDLMHFNDRARAKYTKALKQRFPYGKWQTTNFVHCGRRIEQDEKCTRVSQEE